MSIFDKVLGKLGSPTKDGAQLAEIQSANEQPMDEQKIVSYVKQKIDESRQSNSRIIIEGIYLTNTAYLVGYNQVVFDPNIRQFKNADNRRRINRAAFKINKILPTCQNRLARLCKSPPKYEVRPNSNDVDDKDAAVLGVEIINDTMDKNEFQSKQQELLMSTMQGGHAYVQTSWDPNAGNPMYDPDTGELVGYEGDIKLEILNCLQVFPDPLAKTVEECNYLIKAKVRKLDYFKERFPERGHLVKEEATWLISSTYDMRTNAMSPAGIAGAQINEQQKNSAIELVYYEKRSKDHPNGRMIICASGVLLEDKELPIGEYDIVKFDDILVSGRYNSEAVITHLRPIQDQYVILRTKMADWIKRTLGGKYLAAKGANLSQEALNSESGEVVEYNPVPNAAPPMAMQIPQLPAYTYQDLEVLDKEFDFVSGINEISRGVLPSASIPAAGMAFLQEQDQTRIGVSTNRNEIGYSKVGRHILKYAHKMMQTPRLMKLAGDGLQYTVKEFVGEDINGNYDCRVVPGSTLPDSLVLKRQDLMTAFNAGLLGNPQDPKVQARVLKDMQFGDIQDIWKTRNLDDAQIKKAIDMIEHSQMPVAHEWDNHELFIQELNDFRKTDKFDQMSDEQKGMLNMCVEQHINFLVNLTNPEVGQAQNMAEHVVNTMHEQDQGASGQMGVEPPPQPAGPGIPTIQGQGPQAMGA